LSLSTRPKMSELVITQDRPIPTPSRGFADIVGFGTSGVMILRNIHNPKIFNVISDFSQNAGGWRTDKHVRLLADITGDGNSDIVGFGEASVWVSLSNGNNTFTSPARNVLNDFAYQQGWRIEKHLRYLCDIRKTGRADIVGFGDGGVLVSKNNGNGTFSPAQLVLKDLGYDAGGWRLDRHLRFMADVTGDGYPDIIGFGENHVFISRNNRDGTFAAVKGVINNFTVSSGGWQIKSHPRVVCALTSRKVADIIGFGNAGTYVSLNDGSGSYGQVTLAVKDFGYNQGWRVDKHPRYVTDLTGDRKGDIIGFGDAGVMVSINNGDGTFQPAKLVLNNFGVQQGWSVQKHLRFVVDLTGDGRGDIVGFGENAVYISLNTGGGNFGPVKQLTTQFAFNNGQWSLDQTVRWLVDLGAGRPA